VNFGHRPSGGIVFISAGKNLEKKLFKKDIIKKKGKNLGVGQKYEINCA